MRHFDSEPHSEEIRNCVGEHLVKTKSGLALNLSGLDDIGAKLESLKRTPNLLGVVWDLARISFLLKESGDDAGSASLMRLAESCIPSLEWNGFGADIAHGRRPSEEFLGGAPRHEQDPVPPGEGLTLLELRAQSIQR